MINIRLARKGEFEKVLDFYYTVIDGLGENNMPKWTKGVYPTDGYILSEIEKNQLYVGEKDGEILSAMVLNHESCEGYGSAKWSVAARADEIMIIHILGVRPDSKGKGYGKTLVKKAVEIARKKGCKTIRLDVLSGNIPAARTYESCGFHCVDTVKLYYDDTGWADFYMYEYDLRK